MAAIRTFVAVDSTIDRSLVQSALPTSHGIEIAGIIDGLEESWNALQEAPIDLLVVACGGHADKVTFFIEGALKQRADRPIVVLAEQPQNGFVRRVFEAGADDVVTLPEAPDRVAFTFQKALARRQGAAIASGVALAPMICVLGPKGGTGKTLTATNLAVALAAKGEQVVLIDLDLQFGDVGLALGLTPERTIYDLAKSGGSMDLEKLEAYLVGHPSGIRVLLAPTRPDQASFISVDLLRDIYALLRTKYDYIVVDSPPGFTPEVIASIDSSTDICLVGMLDSLSLKNTKLGLETLELMAYDPSRITLLLNRADSRIGISHDEVEAIIGRAPDVLVPSDREIPKSLTDGQPIVTAADRSEAAKAYRGLAARYLEDEQSRNVASLEPPAADLDHNGHRDPRGGVRQLLRRR